MELIYCIDVIENKKTNYYYYYNSLHIILRIYDKT